MNKLIAALSIILFTLGSQGCALPVLVAAAAVGGAGLAAGGAGLAVGQSKQADAKLKEVAAKYRSDYNQYVIEMEKINIEREKQGLKPKQSLCFEEWILTQKLTPEEMALFKKDLPSDKPEAVSGGEALPTSAQSHPFPP
ncbi:MAG: hypothetical protein FJ135_10695 [Deltaproteobacteria bacterium]|nr:hypothetical protein [Deltaproteobacteria bacterium]